MNTNNHPMELELTRTWYPDGIKGMLFYNNSFQCSTIELPWLNNEPERSCIPEGRYRRRGRYTPLRQAHFLINGIKNRSLILIHPANDALKELKGCIAPSFLSQAREGSRSGVAMEKLKKLVITGPGVAPVFITIKSG